MLIPLSLAIGYCRISNFTLLDYSGTQGFPISLNRLQRIPYLQDTIPSLFALPDWDAVQGVDEPIHFLDFTDHNTDKQHISRLERDRQLFKHPSHLCTGNEPLLCVILRALQWRCAEQLAWRRFQPPPLFYVS